MIIQLLRHATTIIKFAGKTILVDPVLSPAGVENPFPTNRSGKRLKNPLVDIPINRAELNRMITSVDGVLVTHTHSDHFDDLKGEILPKNIQIICQPEDSRKLRSIGFSNINVINSSLEWNGISIIRTKCNHGGVFVRNILGKGSGYLLKAGCEKTLYFTGDTIWCSFVDNTIKQHHPEIIIINGGAAQLPFGRSITMNEKDIEKVCVTSKDSQKVIVHMEAMNHCLLKRDELKNYLRKVNVMNNIHIPNDGESLEFK